MHLVPSDRRFAVATDRVTHFALAANDSAPRFGSLVLYGFTEQPIARLLPLARSWIRPPGITALSGCLARGFHKETRDYRLVAEQEAMSVRIDASEQSPIANVCFVVRNWGRRSAARLAINGAGATDVRQGTMLDTDGRVTMIIWAELSARSPVSVTIRGASPSAGHVAPPAPMPNTRAK
jgi:hypothetical protein